YLLSDYHRIEVEDDAVLTKVPDARAAWLLREWPSAAADAINFQRPHTQLWGIARQRYFDVALVPVASQVEFGDGWYGEEGAGSEVWRWMGKSSVLRLAPLGGKAELMLRFYLPLDALPEKPTITVTLNGQVIDRFPGTDPVMEKCWNVVFCTGTPNELRIDVAPVVNPAAMGLGG